MPTGPKHYRFIDATLEGQPGVAEDCRCLTGEDHGDSDVAEALNVYDAANIWLSHGMDDDYAFGFSDEELRQAAGET